MARQHPKFLHQVVTGTKSNGEFVIHLLDPRVLFKVQRNDKGEITLACLDEIGFYPNQKDIEAIQARATQWLISKE